jgi:hypothetical protein
MYENTIRNPAISLLAIALLLLTATTYAQQKKPNILVIFGDDIGM